jgi:DNA-directed RNA polymerase specialized sigma54-like protein
VVAAMHSVVNSNITLKQDQDIKLLQSKVRDLNEEISSLKKQNQQLIDIIDRADLTKQQKTVTVSQFPKTTTQMAEEAVALIKRLIGKDVWQPTMRTYFSDINKRLVNKPYKSGKASMYDKASYEEAMEIIALNPENYTPSYQKQKK